MRWIAPLFLLLLLLCCSKEVEKPKNCLHISLNTYPHTLDPRKASDFVSSTVICMIYDGLTRCLPGGDVELALAERVEISKDKRVYTFFLKKAYWSDGEPIVARDFELSWKELLSPSSSCSYLFYPIKNAEKCVKGNALIGEVGIRAIDELTLQIELQAPTPYFYSLTAFPSFLPVPSHTDDPSVFSGPFCIEKSNTSEIILNKNSLYWNQKSVSLDQIHISIVPDEMTALHMFEKGELDWLGGSLSPIPPDALEKLQDKIFHIPSSATTFCSFNTQTLPFSNLNLRKAFSLAIGRREIVSQVCPDQIPAQTMLPPSFTNQLFRLSDSVGAKDHFQKALEELKISAAELESLTLYYRPGQVEKRVAQTIQKQWKEVLGVTVQLAQLDFKSHTHRLQNRDYQIALGSWIAQFDDPVSILERFKDRSHLKNYPGWQDGQYVQLLEKAPFSKNREILLLEAEKILAEELPLTPIYHWSSPAISNSRVRAMGSTPSGGILFDRFELAKYK